MMRDAAAGYDVPTLLHEFLQCLPTAKYVRSMSTETVGNVERTTINAAGTDGGGRLGVVAFASPHQQKPHLEVRRNLTR